MGLRSFEYVEPASVQEACQIMADKPEDARIYAGGTTLLLLMKQGIIPRPLSPAEFKRFVMSESEKFAKVIDQAKIRPEG